MIHLDTNYLIGLLVKDSPAARNVNDWLTGGRPLAASSIAWVEFLNGPVSPAEVARVEVVLESRIIPFGREEAKVAAELFNQTGRRRGSRFDALIAATAILADAGMATANRSDFEVFIAHGLRMAASVTAVS